LIQNIHIRDAGGLGRGTPFLSESFFSHRILAAWVSHLKSIKVLDIERRKHYRYAILKIHKSTRRTKEGIRASRCLLPHKQGKTVTNITCVTSSTSKRNICRRQSKSATMRLQSSTSKRNICRRLQPKCRNQVLTVERLICRFRETTKKNLVNSDVDKAAYLLKRPATAEKPRSV
jgi:hypothetical protein